MGPHGPYYFESSSPAGKDALLITPCAAALFQVMCVQYWPAGKNREEVYSGVGVTVENEEQLANFMIRTIRLRKVRLENAPAANLEINNAIN